MGKIKTIYTDTELEGIALIHEIPDEVYAEAAIEDAQRLLELEAEGCAE